MKRFNDALALFLAVSFCWVEAAQALPPTYVNLGTNRSVQGVYYDQTNDVVRLTGYNVTTQRGIVITITAGGAVSEVALPGTVEAYDISTYNHLLDGAYVAAYSDTAPFAGGVWNTFSLTSSLSSDNDFLSLGISDLGLAVGLSAGLYPMTLSSSGATNLLTAPAGYTGEGIARDVSRDGTVIVGGLSAPLGLDKAVAWTSGSPTMLDGESPESLWTNAYGISPWGNYISGASIDIFTGVENATIWNNLGAIQYLPVAGLGLSVSNQGLVAGNDLTNGVGFVWWPGQPTVRTFQSAFPGVIPAGITIVEIRRLYSDGVNAHFAMIGVNGSGVYSAIYARGLDPVTPGVIHTEPDGSLVVIGSSAVDTITISGVVGGIRVVRNGVTTGPYPGITKIKVFGREGNDTITVNSNANVPTELDGGTGRDRLTGSTTQGTLIGGPDNDTLIGGVGVDTFYGGAGNDAITATNGGDYVYGGAGNDTFTGGNGNERVYGQAGTDTLNGNGGNDFIDGGADRDTINGGDGNDVLFGGTGTNDNVRGGNNDDLVFGSSVSNSETVIEQIYQQWSFSGNPINTRITNIQGLGFAPVNDGVADTIRGDANSDWFVRFSTDTATGVTGADVLTNY